ncbi:hypothetical protein B0H10DRAFT_526938 [Mycena sp. CBHHK59/15]|nr:hypothetical protein B0H10DRAFT_526938 [Mycena sp. CBHHK59/15]
MEGLALSGEGLGVGVEQLGEGRDSAAEYQQRAEALLGRMRAAQAALGLEGIEGTEARPTPTDSASDADADDQQRRGMLRGLMRAAAAEARAALGVEATDGPAPTQTNDARTTSDTRTAELPPTPASVAAASPPFPPARAVIQPAITAAIEHMNAAAAERAGAVNGAQLVRAARAAIMGERARLRVMQARLGALAAGIPSLSMASSSSVPSSAPAGATASSSTSAAVQDAINITPESAAASRAEDVRAILREQREMLERVHGLVADVERAEDATAANVRAGTFVGEASARAAAAFDARLERARAVRGRADSEREEEVEEEDKGPRRLFFDR